MKKHRWLHITVVAIAVVIAASWGVSGVLQYGWARRLLMARFAASFGRPIEVGHFEFGLLSGPRIEANRVSLSEDPRFGHEYFLRAERLTATLRWTALLRGRIEFGTLSLTRPSLNLVRAPDGQWNIERWLTSARTANSLQGFPGRSAAAALSTVDDLNEGSENAALSAAIGNQPATTPGRNALAHIRVDSGRINFKRDSDKLPFALVNVNGDLDQDADGRWRLDIAADPMRTSVALQMTGTLRLRGAVTAGAAGLRPAVLTLAWEQSSLADALRLATGQDYGVRGALSAEFSIRTSSGTLEQIASNEGGAVWNVAGILHAGGVHGWDMAGKPDDPNVSIRVAGVWRPGDPEFEISRSVIEAPHSKVEATASMNWSDGFHPRVDVVSSRIAFDDLLAWCRAFSPHISDDVLIDGALSVGATVADWPPRIQRAVISSTGAFLHTGGSHDTIDIGPIASTIERGLLVLGPVSVTLPAIARATRAGGSTSTITGPGAGSLRIEGALGHVSGQGWSDGLTYRVAISGDAQRAQDLLAAASAFGRAANKDWSVTGPVSLHLVSTGQLLHGNASTSGTIEMHGVRLNSALLNQPVTLSSVTIDLRPGERRVKIASAEGLGAQWKGTLHWRADDAKWNFDISADRLNAVELDRWLGPRARNWFLARMLPFALPANQAVARNAAIESLEARGRLRIGTVELAPLRIENLDTLAELRGRTLVLRTSQAGFYGGRLAGELEAHLLSEPTYAFRGQINRANLAVLTASAPSLAGRFTGMASGEVQLAAHGIGRENLLKSMQGQGVLQVHNTAVSGGIAAASIPFASPDNGALTKTATQAHPPATTASFHIAAGQVNLDQLSIAGQDEQLEIEGTVDFGRRLNLRVLSLSRLEGASAAGSEAGAVRGEWIVTGTVDAPQWTRQTRLAGNDAAASRARR